MWEKIKSILQKQGGKCIIIEKGQPTYLVTRLDDEEPADETDQVNKNIDQLAEQSKDEPTDEPAGDDEMQVEKIPF